MKNNKIGISSIEFSIGENHTTSEELSKKFSTPIDFIEEKIGVKKVYHTEQSTTQLAHNSLEKILDKKPELRDKIQLLIVCTQTPTHQLPHTSAQLQSLSRLPTSIMAFDINLGCSGFVYSLSIAESIMEANNLDYGVIITVDKYSSITNDYDKNTKLIFSDASAATLLCREKVQFYPGNYRFGSNGTMFDSLITKVDPQSNKPALHMNGRNIFNFTVGSIPNEIIETCNENKIQLDEIDFFVLHQASTYVINSIGKKTAPKNIKKFINHMDTYGNTTSSSIPIVLARLITELDNKKRNILISGFGVGLSWGSTILCTS